MPVRAATRFIRASISRWRRTSRTWCCSAAPTSRATATVSTTRSTATPAAICLDGGARTDGMSGGAGNDVYYVDNAGDGAFENAGEGNDAVFASAHFALSANVETLVLLGSADLQGYGN